jgi:hypothetical protein
VSVRRRGSEGIGHFVVLKRPGYIYFGSNHVYTVGQYIVITASLAQPAQEASACTAPCP